MTEAPELLERITEAVGHMRITVDTDARVVDPTTEWTACEALVNDPDSLASVVASIAAERQIERLDIALSVFAQGYAYRVAAVGIGAWVLDGAVLDLDPRRMAVAFDQSRPRGVRFTHPRLIAHNPVRDPQALSTLHRELLDRHLTPFIATARTVARVGTRTLWANVGSSCASAFDAFLGALPHQREQIRTYAQTFFAEGPIELARSGELIPVGDRWAWDRKACCLWYQHADNAKCSDCSLRRPDERQARYDQMLAEEGTP